MCSNGCNIFMDVLLKGRVLYTCDRYKEPRRDEVRARIAGSSMFAEAVDFDAVVCGKASLRNHTVLWFIFDKDEWAPPP